MKQDKLDLLHLGSVINRVLPFRFSLIPSEIRWEEIHGTSLAQVCPFELISSILEFSSDLPQECLTGFSFFLSIGDRDLFAI